MKSKSMTPAVSVMLAAFCSSTVLADTRLSIYHSEPGKEPTTQSVLITEGHVRMEQNRQEAAVLLYDQARNTFYAIQPNEKSYLVLDPEKAGAMMDQASEMQRQAMAQMEERLANLPEAQREQMKEMMSRMGQGMPQMTPSEPTRYVPRSEQGSAAGVTCQWVDAYQGEKKVRELCLAEWSVTSMPRADRDTMQAMQKAIQAIVSRIGNAGMFQDDMPDGVPVRVRHFDDAGRLSSEQEVQRVTTDALDGSLFRVPEGYERRELPSLPR